MSALWFGTIRVSVLQATNDPEAVGRHRLAGWWIDNRAALEANPLPLLAAQPVSRRA